MTDITTRDQAASAPTDAATVEWHTVDADDRWPGAGPRTPPVSTRTGGRT